MDLAAIGGQGVTFSKVPVTVLCKNNFFGRLELWEHAVPGEDRSAAAKLAKQAYEAYENQEENQEENKISLDLSGLPISDCPPTFFGLTNLSLNGTKVKAYPSQLFGTLSYLDVSNTLIEDVPDVVISSGDHSIGYTVDFKNTPYANKLSKQRDGAKLVQNEASESVYSRQVCTVPFFEQHYGSV